MTTCCKTKRVKSHDIKKIVFITKLNFGLGRNQYVIPQLLLISVKDNKQNYQLYLDLGSFKKKKKPLTTNNHKGKPILSRRK